MLFYIIFQPQKFGFVYQKLYFFKSANALGISINIFMDFDIETVSDVLSLLFKTDEQLDLKQEEKKGFQIKCCH